MKHTIHTFPLLLLLLLLLLPMGLFAQAKTTAIKGKVVDAQTGEALPFVTVAFVGTQIGTTTDFEGNFSLENTQGYTVVQFRMMGYQTLNHTLEYGRRESGVKIALRPTAKMLETVEIRPKGKKTRYKRKNNPAVDLVKNVIAHREENYVEFGPAYSCTSYEKIIMALDDVHPHPDSSFFWRTFPFLTKYVDTLSDEMAVLGISLRENLRQERHDPAHDDHEQRLTARRLLGLDNILDKEGIGESTEELLRPVNIFDSDVELMLNHFVGPLSPLLATTYYRYYITDTVLTPEGRMVELSFIPANKESYGFTGRMLIAADSTYALHSYRLEVSPKVNLNFVSGLAIEQTYSRLPDGRLAPDSTWASARLYVLPKMQQLYVYQQRKQFAYREPEALPHPDSVRLKRRFREWNSLRPAPLRPKETLLDSLGPEVRRMPITRRLLRVGEIALSGYLPTRLPSDSSRFDIGSLYSFVSFNNLEGLRLRVGGMTTANLNSHHFANGYLAYGFRDQQPKFNLHYYYTFKPRRHHYREQPRSWFGIGVQREVAVLGQSFSLLSRDNIIMSSDKERPALYLLQADAELRYRWHNHLGVATMLMLQQYTAASAIPLTNSSGIVTQRSRDLEWNTTFSFDPRSAATSTRGNIGSMLSVAQNAPSVALSHTFGWIDEGHPYTRTDISADYRLWLSAFGHIDFHAKAGVVWNAVPLHKLYSPAANASSLVSEGTFGTMRPMEFVMDQYVELHADYFLKGWLLNRVPLIKRLRLREVLTFSGLYGDLSPRNYAATTYASAFGIDPFIEVGVGLENILHIFRIDYVRRLTYTEGRSRSECGAIKIGLKFSL